jgi:hypothetical protein
MLMCCAVGPYVLIRDLLVLMFLAFSAAKIQLHQNNFTGDLSLIVCPLGPFTELFADCL